MNFKKGLAFVGFIILLAGIFVLSGSITFNIDTSLARKNISFSRSTNIKALPTELNIVSCEKLLKRQGLIPSQFNESIIDNKLVCWQQQTINNNEYIAIVEKAQKVYQFNKETGKLIKKIDTFNYNLPKKLPGTISRQEAESKVDGDIQFSQLYYMAKDSDVFPVRTNNPIWLIKSHAGKNQTSKIIDAISGRMLNDAVLPPADAYSFSGPQHANGTSCWGAWTNWYQSAETGFETLGYPTDTNESPTKSTIQSYVQDNDIKLFYEAAHGGPGGFGGSCNGWIDYTYSTDIESWLSGYNKKDFTFIASCTGMCETELLPWPPYSSSLSHAFRKGSAEDTATVGYCGMSDSGPCENGCWYAGYTVPWQDALFSYMNNGGTVYQAFQDANADYPACETPQCMRFAGDQNYIVKFGAGHLCDANTDCGSEYCEGSYLHPKRCGTSGPPTPDGWYDGGNNIGCGTDPDSVNKDYYYDENGAENFDQVGDPFNCDLQDDCGPNCPELNERTDYFVIENTNTCNFVTFDADNNELDCTDCMGNNWWNLGGDIGQCCSDDLDEYITTRICNVDACTSNPSDNACCNSASKCVYEDICYVDGYEGDIDSDSKNEKCQNGIWIVANPIDPLAPILLAPTNEMDFILGQDIMFEWNKASGTNPQGYWFRVYKNGEIFDEYGADPVYGFYFGLAVEYLLESNITEIVAGDGIWEWEVGVHFGVNRYQDIHWSETRILYKNTAGVLLTPNDNAEVSVNELFDWETVPGATNYIAKITGLLPFGLPYYLSLNSQQSQFTLTQAFYDALKLGLFQNHFTWAVAGTRYFTDNQDTLGKFSYSEPRSFTKQ